MGSSCSSLRDKPPSSRVMLKDTSSTTTDEYSCSGNHSAIEFLAKKELTTLEEEESERRKHQVWVVDEDEELTMPMYSHGPLVTRNVTSPRRPFRDFASANSEASTLSTHTNALNPQQELLAGNPEPTENAPSCEEHDTTPQFGEEANTSWNCGGGAGLSQSEDFEASSLPTTTLETLIPGIVPPSGFDQQPPLSIENNNMHVEGETPSFLGCQDSASKSSSSLMPISIVTTVATEHFHYRDRFNSNPFGNSIGSLSASHTNMPPPLGSQSGTRCPPTPVSYRVSKSFGGPLTPLVVSCASNSELLAPAGEAF